jgi:adenosylcobinamide-phosphate synthase
MIEAALALGLEAILGYPPGVAARIGHPVQWIGAFIALLERTMNSPSRSDLTRRALGLGTALAVAGCGAGFGWILERLARRTGLGPLAVALAATPGLAQRSLHDHASAVLRPLRQDQLEEARAAVSRIVGRDTAMLDAGGVVAAALESLAESFNDGVVAPAVWLAIGGLPGLYAYSMIGHKERRWRDFGWASARADDAANLAPARLAGGLIAAAAGRGWGVMIRDAGKHASPNAGWPEAAMAGALGVRLGGPATYDGVVHPRPIFGEGGPAPVVEDLARGLAVYRRACVGLAMGLAVAALWRSLDRRSL